MGLLDAERVHEADDVADPEIESVVRIGPALGIAEARSIRGDRAELPRQHRQREAPVGIAGHARSGAVQQDGREAFAFLEIVCLKSRGDHGLADFRILESVHFLQPSIVVMLRRPAPC